MSQGPSGQGHTIAIGILTDSVTGVTQVWISHSPSANDSSTLHIRVVILVCRALFHTNTIISDTRTLPSTSETCITIEDTILIEETDTSIIPAKCAGRCSMNAHGVSTLSCCQAWAAS